MLHGLFTHIGEQLQAVDAHDPMRAGSALAQEHGTRYPIMQGPMANVSDNADFAAAVLAQGGLPFFALGNLPANLADDMLAAGKKKVDRFGAGMIGIEAFNETISHHLASVKKIRGPLCALCRRHPLPGQGSGSRRHQDLSPYPQPDDA